MEKKSQLQIHIVCHIFYQTDMHVNIYINMVMTICYHVFTQSALSTALYIDLFLTLSSLMFVKKFILFR